MMSNVGSNIDLADLEIGDEIGSGGQAIVRRVRNHRQMLFKEYRGVRIDPVALDRLIDWRRNLGAGDRELLDRSASWPQARVNDGDATVGVLIPEAPERFKIDVRGTTKLNEVQYLAFGDRAAKLGLRLPGPGERAEIIATLADLLELFDRHRIVHGDISFKNVLWTVKGRPGTYLLDCDGARQGQHSSALPQVTTQHWTDPRVQNGTIRAPDLDSDRLGLGLLFYRTYFQVRGNFTGMDLNFEIPDTPPLNRTADDLLARTLHARTPRSSASEWQRIRHLKLFLEQNGHSGDQVPSARPSARSAPTYGAKQAPSTLAAPPAFDPSAPRQPEAQPAIASPAPQQKQSSLNKPFRSNRIMQLLVVLCIALAIAAIALATGAG